MVGEALLHGWRLLFADRHPYAGGEQHYAAYLEDRDGYEVELVAPPPRHGNGATEGAHRACVLLGIIATCRALRVPAQAYLAWAFERLGTHRDVFDLPLEELTPAAFKKTLG